MLYHNIHQQQHIIAHIIKIEDNTITMKATSVAAAATDSQHQTMSPLGMMPLTPLVKKNGISWPSSIGVLVCQVHSSSTACNSPTGHRNSSPFPAFWMWACSKTLLSNDINREGWREQGGGEKQAACLFLVACFEKQYGTAPPATSSAAHIWISRCGHAPKPSPSIKISQAACFFFVVYFEKNVASELTGPLNSLFAVG
jgi:hypothetical protein